MAEIDTQKSTLLLVEDNPADAELIEDLLEQAQVQQFQIVRVSRIADAIEKLKQHTIDIVLLDLRLPDSSGTKSVEMLRAVTDNTPIVVLTGIDDEELALACISAGAQDYLLKGEIRSIMLRRTIGYAISRLREAQLRDIRTTLMRLRNLSMVTPITHPKATHEKSIPLHERAPQIYHNMVGIYLDLLSAYLDYLLKKGAKPRDQMIHLITQLGDMDTGPRDLLDIHIAALDILLAQHSAERARLMAIEGRLLALELMGLLVDYYRVG